MGSTGPCAYRLDGSKPYGLDFPFVTIGDMVRAQKALLDHLGVQKLASVVGGSIGNGDAAVDGIRRRRNTGVLPARMEYGLHHCRLIKFAVVV